MGFYLNDSVTWNEHVEKLVTKLQSNINLFKLCRSYISTFAARQFYFQFIHSHLISGIQIYLNLSQKYLLDSIFLKQKSAMRIIDNVHRIPNHLTDIRTLCKAFNISPPPSLLVYFNSIYGYQIFNNSVPEFVSNLFISVNSRYPRRDIFKLNPCNDIKINTSITKS